MKWNLWPCLYWLFWAIGFAVWETYAGLDHLGRRDVPMLTQVVVRYVPWWVTLPGITWLFIHFALRYSNPTYLQQFEGK